LKYCYSLPLALPNLLNLLESAADYQRCTNVMIMGDFNYPAIDFANHTVNSGCASDAFQFFDKCQELCLFQHVLESTRFRNEQQPSCLDYVFTDEDNFVQDLQYQSPLGKSDHVVLTWNIIVYSSCRGAKLLFEKVQLLERRLQCHNTPSR